jgi:protein ImuB
MKPALAMAPTPLAASVAARCDRPFQVDNKAQLVSQLGGLPLGPLRWPEELVMRLAKMGVRTIGQALRLPRSGFARRFGTGPLGELDRLIGRNPDLRRSFEPRERFRRRRELGFELESADRILAAMAPLLADLGRFLRVRQCGVMELQCLLRHRRVPPSQCVVRLAAPLANVARLTGLLGDRLNALALPEPVRSCELRSGALVGQLLDSESLWRPGEHGGGGNTESTELVERLRSKLGMEAVYGLQVMPAHRPESAWSTCEPRAEQASVATRVGPPAAGMPPSNALALALASASVTPWPPFTRPLWLLGEPQLLQERDGRPRRRGALKLLGDPERIETGWWDGGDVQRHYYKALDIHGVQLWIFRECPAPHRWFLHGVFG